MNFKEKCQKYNQKYRNMDNRLESYEKKLENQARRHKVINELRYNDNQEMQNAIKGRNFERSCDISEKHIALSLMNQDRKMFMQNHNDKYRARLARENIEFKS